MNIAVIEKKTKIYDVLYSFVIDRFNGVSITSFDTLENLLDTKIVYEYVYIDYDVYRKLKMDKKVNVYVKNVICVCTSKEMIDTIENHESIFIEESKLQDSMVEYIRTYIKEEKLSNEIFGKRKQIHTISMIIFMCLLLLDFLSDEGKTYINIFIYILPFIYCREYYVEMRVKKIKVSIFKLCLRFVCFLVGAILLSWMVDYIISILK